MWHKPFIQTYIKHTGFRFWKYFDKFVFLLQTMTFSKMLEIKLGWSSLFFCVQEGLILEPLKWSPTADNILLSEQITFNGANILFQWLLRDNSGSWQIVKHILYLKAQTDKKEKVKCLFKHFDLGLWTLLLWSHMLLFLLGCFQDC